MCDTRFGTLGTQKTKVRRAEWFVYLTRANIVHDWILSDIHMYVDKYLCAVSPDLSLVITVIACASKLTASRPPYWMFSTELVYLEMFMRENQINMQTQSCGLCESLTHKRYHKRVCEMDEQRDFLCAFRCMTRLLSRSSSNAIV